jgi:hypothetical protein
VVLLLIVVFVVVEEIWRGLKPRPKPAARVRYPTDPANRYCPACGEETPVARPLCDQCAYHLPAYVPPALEPDGRVMAELTRWERAHPCPPDRRRSACRDAVLGVPLLLVVGGYWFATWMSSPLGAAQAYPADSTGLYVAFACAGGIVVLVLRVVLTGDSVSLWHVQRQAVMMDLGIPPR